MATQVTQPAQVQSIDSIDSARLSDRSSAYQATSTTGTWIGFFVLTTLALAVFWAFDALPFQDLPAHAGLIALRHRIQDSAFEQKYYVFAPHIGPYSLFRFLGETFTSLTNPLSAVRALATLPVLATPLALLFARRRLHGDTSATFGFLGLALSFGFMTLMGFASYLLGTAVMLFALTLWLELLATTDTAEGRTFRHTWKKEAIVAAVASFVFVAHGHAFVLLLIFAATSAFSVGEWRWARVLRARVFIPAIAIAAWVAWRERGGTTPAGSATLPTDFTLHFQGVYDKFTLLVTPTLMTRTGIDLFVGILVWAITIVSVVYTFKRANAISPANDPLARERHVHARALFACALVITVVFLFLPHAVGWFGFVDGRLVPLILFLLLLSVRVESLPNRIRGIFERSAPAFAALIIALALVASKKFQSEAEGYDEVLSHVPNEASLLNLPLDPNSDIFTGHPFVHYDKLVWTDRHVLVSDVWFHQGSALYPTTQNPSLRLPATYSESDLHEIEWPSYNLNDWDYVLIRTRPSATAPETPKSLALLDHKGGWWLFRHAR